MFKVSNATFRFSLAYYRFVAKGRSWRIGRLEPSPFQPPFIEKVIYRKLAINLFGILIFLVLVLFKDIKYQKKFLVVGFSEKLFISVTTSALVLENNDMRAV